MSNVYICLANIHIQHIYVSNIYTVYIQHTHVKKHSVVDKMDLYMVFLIRSGLKTN